MREEHDIFHAAFVDEEIEQAETHQSEYQRPTDRFPDHTANDRIRMVQMLRAMTQQEAQSTTNELDEAWQRIVSSSQYETYVQQEQADNTINDVIPISKRPSTVTQRGKTSNKGEPIPLTKQRSQRVLSILAAVACITLVVGSMLWIENRMQISKNRAGNLHNGKTTPTITTTPPQLKLAYTYTQTGSYDISSIRWSPTGDRLLSVGNTIKVWDFTHTFLSLNNPVRWPSTHVVWSPDGASIAINNSATGIEIRDATTGLLQRTCAAPITPPGQPGADIQSQQQSLLSARVPYTSQFADSTDGYFNLAWSPDGKYLAATFREPGSGSAFVGLVVYATADCNIAWQTSGHYGSVGNYWGDMVEWSPDSHYLALSDSLGQSADIVNLATKRIVYTYPYDATVKYSPIIDSISWSPDGKRIAMHESDRTGGFISISDALTGAHTFTYRETDNTNYESNLAWSPDSKYIISTNETGVGTKVSSATRIWNATTGQVIHTFASRLTASAVAWSPDGDYIAIGYAGITDSSSSNSTKDATIAVWHIPHW